MFLKNCYVYFAKKPLKTGFKKVQKKLEEKNIHLTSNQMMVMVLLITTSLLMIHIMANQ